VNRATIPYDRIHPARDPRVLGRADNELTEQEKRDGWVPLFDGKSMADWRIGAKICECAAPRHSPLVGLAS